MKKNNMTSLKEFINKSDKEKLNIAIFTDCYYPLIGGITTRVYNQALELSKYANVLVVCGNVKGYEDDENLPFTVLRCNGLKFSEYQGHIALPDTDSKFKKLLLSLDIDVIHLHTYFSMAHCAHWLHKKKNIPLVQISHQRLYPEYLTIVHSRLIAKLLTQYSKNMISKADEIWTVSKNVVEFYKKSGIKKDIKIDPSGTDKKYPENAEIIVQQFNQKYNIENDDNILVCAGRMEAKQKNLFFMLDACKTAIDKGAKFKLFLAGKGKDLEKIREYIKRIGLQDACSVLGCVDADTLNALFLRADLHLFPSKNDNFGLTKVESAILGTPTLGLEGTAVTEGIVDGQNGYVSKDDLEDFANKIIEILQDKSKLKIVSEEAKQTLGKSWEETSKTTLSLTKSFLNNIQNDLDLKQKEVKKKSKKLKSA